MENKICLYAIAKNESKNVDEWYETVKEADSIAVLDTGSSDDTVQKLKEHPNVIVEQKAYDHFRFDQARNDSLALIPEDCNICFTIDLDERLNPGWADILRNEWNPEKYNRGAYSYYYRDDQFEQTRNWIHSKDWTWLYPCHEAMGRNGVIWYQHHECLDLHGKIMVRHYPDHSKSRVNYMDLLALRSKENPEDGESFVYFIRENIIQCDYKRVLEYEEQIKESPNLFTNIQAGAALIYLGDAFCATGQIEKGIDCYQRSIIVNPKVRAGYVKLAQWLIETKKPEAAKDTLLTCLDQSEKTNKFTWVDNDQLWTWKVYDWLCVACYWSKEYIEALTYAKLALAADPGNQHIIQNIKRCEEKIQNGR